MMSGLNNNTMNGCDATTANNNAMGAAAAAHQEHDDNDGMDGIEWDEASVR